MFSHRIASRGIFWLLVAVATALIGGAGDTGSDQYSAELFTTTRALLGEVLERISSEEPDGTETYSGIPSELSDI